MGWYEAAVAIGMVMFFIFPAYTANSYAVLVGGGMPMDFGRFHRDGRRILGKGKTWRGFIFGSLLASGVGVIINYAGNTIPHEDWTYPWSRADWSYSSDWSVAIAAILLLCFGAMTGDAVGSYIKRRRGIESGGKALLLDQLTFLAFAFLFVFTAMPLWSYSFFIANSRWVGVVFVFFITPIIHRAVNWAGYKIGAKKVPW